MGHAERGGAAGAYLRFVHQLTQREISQRIGCSQMHVSRLLRRSMLRLEADASAS
jgi:RNA polymerase sigma-B factor